MATRQVGTEKRELVKDVPSYEKTDYKAKEPDKSIRACPRRCKSKAVRRNPLVDVLSPKEYSGELISMPNYPQEGAHAAGTSPVL